MGEMPEEMREFYQWLEQQVSEGEKVAPVGFMMQELNLRGNRIQRLGAEISELRGRLSEREVAMVQIQAELERSRRDLADLEGRYRASLAAGGEHRRVRREVEEELEKLREGQKGLGPEAASVPDRAVDDRNSAEDEGYRRVRVEHLNQMLDQIQQAEERAHAAEMERVQQTEHFREVFADKDNVVRNLHQRLEETQASLHKLEGWVNAGLVTRFLRGHRK